MDKIKKALGIGAPVYKHDDALDATMQRVRMQQEQHLTYLREQHLAHLKAEEQLRMNSAQNYASSGYQSGWQDPRGMMNAVPSSPSIAELYENVKRNNAIAKDLMNKIDRTEKKVEMLTGFYTWITEVYPEIAAQHKAMRDLYEAANSNEMKTEAGP